MTPGRSREVECPRSLAVGVGPGHYRGPVEGLYLCGSSSHPGGNVGLAGYNCAQVVAKDVGFDAPWLGPTAEDRLAADGR